MKILIVDDCEFLRRSLARMLAAVPGVEGVACAADVAGAMQAIQTQRPDVVVLDIQLRGNERGLQVLRYVKRTCPDTQVAMLSNFGWSALREGFALAGASAYFDKAFETGDLRNWVADRAREAASATV